MNMRILGTIAMVCAPAMLIESVVFQGENNVISIGVASVIFMAGWICSNIGLQRLQAAGTGVGGRTVLTIQLIGVVLALAFGFIEGSRLLAEDNPLFIVTNIAWPFSMIFMLVVGIAVLRARRLPGWQRWVPLLCGLALPVSLPVLAFVGEAQGGLLFFTLLAVLWMLLGYIVRTEGRAVTSVPATSAA